MARPLRIELAGGVYHVTSRGDRREDIYLCDDDRVAWLHFLEQVCERFNWRCHGWCQMSNHYHFVVETIEGNLSQGMRHLNGVYTQHVNRAHQRVGHVFQGRYKAVMVEKEGHLLELARYVVLNPVRAGVGLPSVWEGLRGQIYLGSDAFVQRMQVLADQPLAEVPRMQRRPMALPLEDYVLGSTDRKAAMAAAYASGDHTLQAVADAFGVHYATVSRAVNG